MELMKIFGLRHLVKRTPGQVTKKSFVTIVELQWPKICFGPWKLVPVKSKSSQDKFLNSNTEF